MTSLKRILVVDDESSLLFSLVANLELEGYEVQDASTAEEALSLLETESFDLVLSDIRMPGMNGVELFHQIRQRDPEMPVVLMTGFAMEALINEAIENGVFTVLSKPFEVEHLMSALSSAAKRPLVLVVDDEVAVADSTAAALNASGVAARAVFEGKAALDVVKENSTDVCILDLVMPEMAGHEVAERLRSIDPSIACIALTGHDLPEIFQRAAPYVIRILRKPVDLRQLVKVIAEARGRTLA